jgi:hypothetical protein
MTLDALDARADRVWARAALTVEGEVGAGYDGGAYIPVIQRLLEAVRAYAPESVRVRRANDGGEWAPSIRV